MTSPRDTTNAIIIDNQFYVYVPTCGHKDDCHGCQLRERCRRMREDYGYGYCAVFGAEIGYSFRLLKGNTVSVQSMRGNAKLR